MCSFAGAALAVSTIGGISDASQQRQIGRANAATATAEAAQTREIGQFNEARARDKMSRLIGQQRGQYAVRGVQLNSASAQRMGAEAAEEMNLEATAQRFNTESRVTSLTNEATLQSYRGQMGYMSGMAQVGANALTGSLKLWPELAGS